MSAVCCWGWGAWTKGAFIAVGSGCLRTDNGLILLILKLIAVCSLPFQGEKRGQWEQETEASVVGMKGKIPRGTYERVAEDVRLKQQSWKERRHCDTEVLLSGVFIFLLTLGVSSCLRPGAGTQGSRSSFLRGPFRSHLMATFSL